MLDPNFFANLPINPFLIVFGLAAFTASVLFFPLDVLIVLMLMQGVNPVGLIIAAVGGGILGSLTSYWLGMEGRLLVSHRHKHGSRRRKKLAEKLFDRIGRYSLLFICLPLMGDVLTITAGARRMRIRDFVMFSGAGRLVYYSLLVLVIHLSKVGLVDLHLISTFA